MPVSLPEKLHSSRFSKLNIHRCLQPHSESRRGLNKLQITKAEKNIIIRKHNAGRDLTKGENGVMYNILVCVLSTAIPEDFTKIMLLSVIKCKFTKEVFAGLVDKLFLG